jgi:hypothetical protein
MCDIVIYLHARGLSSAADLRADDFHVVAKEALNEEGVRYELVLDTVSPGAIDRLRHNKTSLPTLAAAVVSLGNILLEMLALIHLHFLDSSHTGSLFLAYTGGRCGARS